MTLSTVPSDGIELIPESALVFNVGAVGTRLLAGAATNLMLVSNLGASRTDFLERVRTWSVAVVDAVLIFGMPSVMPTKVTMVRDENLKMWANFMLEWCFG